MYAHSLKDRPTSEWESLSAHSIAVANAARRSAEVFGWGMAAYAAGLLHDIGKASTTFQDYIASPPSGRKGPDHSTAGAREALRLYGVFPGRLLAYVIAGHHAGLSDHEPLGERLATNAIEDCQGWTDHIAGVPSRPSLMPSGPFKVNQRQGYSIAFLARMLFSCLVDADFIETERFYGSVPRGQFTQLDTLQARLVAFLGAKQRDDSPLNVLRSRILAHAVSRATLPPGLFTLTAPTGGGKTLTSLAFAMEHARLHGLRRIIYVIPYTSIIEQTAAVFREALGTADDILEHHASFDWEGRGAADPKLKNSDQAVADSDDEGVNGIKMLRRASENWDAPIVVTTAVQFFESLHANRSSRCRKLHNIAKSVVVLDEAQTLPLRLLLPCMAAIEELAANYSTSVVLCTATQPALRVCDGFSETSETGARSFRKIGFAIDDDREIAPDPDKLARTLKRVDVVRLSAPIEDDVIIARFAELTQMLCIVNARAHARELFDLLKSDPRTVDGAFHLTTLMCPKHRRAVLAEVRDRLQAGAPVRLVSTSLMEAGVDVDFPEVWRAVAGLDSIAQAAGRCNREGKREMGRVVVFEPANRKSPPDFVPAIHAADTVFRHNLDPLSIEGVAMFFRELYWERGAESMDAPTLDNAPWPILKSIHDRFDTRTLEATFDFESIARAFRVIDDAQATVIVPLDQGAINTLRRIAAMERPRQSDLRTLQQYSVAIPRSHRNGWLAAGVLRPVHASLKDSLLVFQDLAHYRSDSGIDLKTPDLRDSVSNIL